MGTISGLIYTKCTAIREDHRRTQLGHSYWLSSQPHRLWIAGGSRSQCHIDTSGPLRFSGTLLRV
eukprot:4328028-Amphidinium_carterae.1